MPLTPLEQVEFGGVDTRSNPLNMPPNRWLRCLNWVPRIGGWLELRWGYATVLPTAFTNSVAIHTLIPYTLFTGTRYLIRWQGNVPYQITINTGAVVTPTYQTGANWVNSGQISYYSYNNRIYAGNGTEPSKYFDGTTWRLSGLGALTSLQATGVGVSLGLAQVSDSVAAAVTVTVAAGGTIPISALSGYSVYMAIFDTATNELSPATTFLSANQRYQVTTGGTQELQLANLPVLSGTQIKVFGLTADGASAAYPCITSFVGGYSSLSRSGSLVTVNAPGHVLTTGNVVAFTGPASEPLYTGLWTITVVNANVFTFTMKYPVGALNPVGTGAYSPVLTAAAASTTTTITSNTVLNISPGATNFVIINDPNRGIPPSSIGGPNPGYQFYVCLQNKNIGSNGTSLILGHVGNRMSIGTRLAPATRSNVNITFPSGITSDPEQTLLIGRTGDGALIPYACIDSNGLTVPVNIGNAVAGITLVHLDIQGSVDGNSELPFRNGIVPATCDKFAVVSDFVYAADSSSPTIRRSGSAQFALTGQFVGDPAQSWAPNDIDTFPTNQSINCVAETNGTLFVATLTDSALLVDTLGIPMWVGPWTKGAAGKRAFTKTDHGFYWVSADLELVTFVNGAPVAVSDEYLQGEMAQLSKLFLSTIELVYYRSAILDKDEIRILGQKADGTPHTVVHDFKIKDQRSLYGQGRGEEYLGPLATMYTQFQGGSGQSSIINANNNRVIWVGATNGQLYQLYFGSDDVGSQFTADAVGLVNAGMKRPSVQSIDFFGDSNIVISYLSALNGTVDSGDATDLVQITPLDGTPIAMPGFEDGASWRVPIPIPELKHVYIRIQLTSHSADGSLTVNPLPHCPLETYGRLYKLVPNFGDEDRGA
jgi:hypothetical protein